MIKYKKKFHYKKSQNIYINFCILLMRKLRLPLISCFHSLPILSSISLVRLLSILFHWNSVKDIIDTFTLPNPVIYFKSSSYLISLPKETGLSTASFLTTFFTYLRRHHTGFFPLSYCFSLHFLCRLGSSSLCYSYSLLYLQLLSTQSFLGPWPKYII